MITSQPGDSGNDSGSNMGAINELVAAVHAATLFAHLVEPPDVFHLQSGEFLPELTIAYQTYGHLNADRNNTILVCHGFTGSAHAAGIDPGEAAQQGWWNSLIGPDKPFDTNRYFVISSNVIGGCQGSTGPSSINPQAGKPYGSLFPRITIGDMVAAQHLLLKSMRIDRLLCVTGGSMGGMQAMEWGMRHPDMVVSAMPIACGARLSAQALALSIAARLAIEADAEWHGGDYYDLGFPARGLSAARFLTNITYLSPGYLEGCLSTAGSDLDIFQEGLEAETHQFVQRFDANSFRVLSLAMESFDLTSPSEYAALADASNCPQWHLISYNSDWLFPSAQLQDFRADLNRVGVEATHVTIDSRVGHDSFIVETELIAPEIQSFLSRIAG